MKKLSFITLFILTIFFYVQPLNISKADLASTLLNNAQKLVDKQKIKGNKLQTFILNNMITIDYEGELLIL